MKVENPLGWIEVFHGPLSLLKNAGEEELAVVIEIAAWQVGASEIFKPWFPKTRCHF